MKRNVWSYLMALFLLAGLAACSNDDVRTEEELPKGTTYMSLSFSIPQQSSLRVDEDYNNTNILYPGRTEIVTVDIYLLSQDGNSMLDSRRFDYGDFAIIIDPGNNKVGLMLKEPFKTTAGVKKMIVIINSPDNLSATIPAEDALYALSQDKPLSTLARIDQAGQDILVLTGKSDVFTVEDGVSAEDVKSQGKNMVPVNVVRVPSRVIVTTTAPDEVVNSEGVTMGTISNVTYAVAQGANAVYIFPHKEGAYTRSWGYDYVPTGNDYQSTATQYYDYADLYSTPTAIPAKPAEVPALLMMPGKFLLENTHKRGEDIANSEYRKGNTAYVLIRATFTPDPSIITDGGALVADGTFYVGGTNGKVYSSAEAAGTPPLGILNQPVAKYSKGKVLYHAWLNPGPELNKPVNSPVIRNNIYHINITAFKNFGLNWNPLVPGPNPDPKPTGNEPENPVKPNDPLTPTDTYMSVDINVLMWTVHSYDIEL